MQQDRSAARLLTARVVSSFSIGYFPGHIPNFHPSLHSLWVVLIVLWFGYAAYLLFNEQSNGGVYSQMFVFKIIAMLSGIATYIHVS